MVDPKTQTGSAVTSRLWSRCRTSSGSFEAQLLASDGCSVLATLDVDVQEPAGNT